MEAQPPPSGRSQRGLEARSRIARRLRRQADSCRRLGSPLYAGLLELAAADAEAGGPVARVLDGRDMDPAGSALALRLMGAVHRLVLEGKAAALARHFPTAGGRAGEPGAAWPAFVQMVEARADEVRSLVDRPVQTNEVGRSAALVGGFLLVARSFGRPLRVLEIGASAGLNLLWDRYRYEARGVSWGPEDSPVRLCDYETPPTPPFDQAATVAERAGCDPNPIDPTSEDGRLTLLSYVWADQLHRVRLMRGALVVVAAHPVTVERGSADEWLERCLAEPAPGLATVVVHSIVLQYLSEDVRAGVDRCLESAGGRATEAAPLARLSMEPGGDEADVHLTMWPSGERRLIARAGYHGRPVRWLP